MERLQSIAERIARVSVYAGGTLLLIAVGLVTFEVLARKMFNYSMAGADELSGYAYALSMTWGYAYALHRGAHIRVDVIYMRLPLPAQCVLDVVSLSAFAFLVVFLTYRGYFVLEQTISVGGRADTPLATPLVIPQVPWLLGMAFFSFCVVLLLVRSFRALVKRDLSSVQEIAKGTGEHVLLNEEATEATERVAAERTAAGGDQC